jgi:RNA polymerase sigma-70 factor (ECF subfamily)
MSDENRSQELEWIRQAKLGNTDAFGALYSLHAESVYRFLLSNLGDVQEAEDLTEEVFIRVWRAIPSYEEGEFPFTAFVFRIARNLLIDHFRANHRKMISVSIEAENLDESLKDPDATPIYNLEHEELYAALHRLREDYREILVLRFLSDLSIIEISKAMDRSPGAVRVLQHRALAALRKVLQKNPN